MNRPVERIDYFLDNIDWVNLIRNIWKIEGDLIFQLEGFELEKFAKELSLCKEDIRKKWKQESDLRISQVLITNNYLPYIPGFWYGLEDWQILLKQGINPRNFLFWGSFGLNRDAFKWILIKNMSFSHIKNILKDFQNQNQLLHPEFLKAFKDELKYDFKTIENE